MRDWTAGYVTDLGYTTGYFPELNPMLIQLAFINAGLVPPRAGHACELGFGQGVSVNVHAAASNWQWHGTDFNPAQAGLAQTMAQASGAHAQLQADAFAEYAARTDLPDFDFIALHGIWSWISAENRQVLVDFIDRKLKVGGVLYISYNTWPGWSAFAPMRELMQRYVQTQTASGLGLPARIDAALNFADHVLAQSPRLQQAFPSVRDSMARQRENARAYLAHEFFNQDWQPMFFSEVAEKMSGARLQFACSASLLEHVDLLHLNAEQQVLLNSIADPMMRQTTRDLMVNQIFRRDYWVRGARKLSDGERLQQLAALRLVLLGHAPQVPTKVIGALGEATLNEAVYKPLIDLMADHQVRSLGEIQKALEGQLTPAQLMEMVLVYCASNQLALVQDDAVIEAAEPHTRRLNDWLIQQARWHAELPYQVSPVHGGALAIGRFPILFLQAWREGGGDTSEQALAGWVQSVWALLRAQRQQLVVNGQALEGEEAHHTELTRMGEEFRDRMLPILKALRIA